MRADFPMNRYIVLLETPKGKLVPMRSDDQTDDTLPEFSSQREARKAALDSIFGREFGFRVYDADDFL